MPSAMQMSFNPLLRGVGILTKIRHHINSEGIQVSIPFFGAWVFLPEKMPDMALLLVSFNPLLRGVGILT